MTVTRRITPRQQKALDWLIDHSGDAAFTNGGETIIAQGQTAHGFKREDWVKLRDAARVEFYQGPGRGYGRVRVKT